VLNSAAFPTGVKAGTITVNGQQITIETTDTLQGVFNKINSATSGDVTASYDPSADAITLTSASNSEMVLGTATDTSNFLQVARLSNNGTASVSSSSALGSVRTSAALSLVPLATPIDDGGSGAGKFKINGVEIDYDAGTDSIADVLQRINDSTAGVTASYDSTNDRFLLTSKASGDIGIALEEVAGAGNFLSATGLLGSALQRGRDLLYTVNNGGQLSSHSNTITEDSSGITGLSVTALDAGDVTVEVASDSDKIKPAITGFIDDYNKAQGLIDTNTASSTDAKGQVTAGTLSGESDAYSVASELRRLVTSSFSSLTGSIKRLEGLGITSNGDNNNLALGDPAKLDLALSGNLSEVKSLFTNSADGLAVKLNDYLENTVGTEGSLITKQDNLGKQASGIDNQIAEQERQVQATRQQLIDGFLAMEQAQLKINQQLQFLSQRFGSGSASSG